MHLGLRALETFLQARQAESHLVLVTVVATEGSTYRKPGAMMLVDSGGDFAGLISGGCLEGDLVSRTRRVLDSGQSLEVSYDLKDDDELVFGLGLGCGGAVNLLLQRLDRAAGFEPLASLFQCLAGGAACRLALVTDPGDTTLALGEVALSGGDGATLGPPGLLVLLAEQVSQGGDGRRARSLRLDTPEGPARVLLVDVQPTPCVLICGAGPDAEPLVRQVVGQGWTPVVFDHRPAFADPGRFPADAVVVCDRPERLAEAVDLARVDAAVVMSHHVAHDADYLRVLAAQPPTYIGLLGPRARRDDLLDTIGASELRVHGPAGLDLGAELPEAIALAIMAEIHAVLNERDGASLDRG